MAKRCRHTADRGGLRPTGQRPGVKCKTLRGHRPERAVPRRPVGRSPPRPAVGAASPTLFPMPFEVTGRWPWRQQWTQAAGLENARLCPGNSQPLLPANGRFNSAQLSQRPWNPPAPREH